ncbi:MAG: polysaccharide biosynthesis/export family protein [Pseudomonadota bacterium]
MRIISVNTAKAAGAAIMLSAMTACTSGAGSLPALESASATQLRVGPGDKVRVSVQDLDNVNGDYTIDETGSISLPLVQQVRIGGMTYVEAGTALTQALIAKDILKAPNVTVQPLELRPISILGEVRNPGEIEYRQGMTVFEAVSQSGGYTYRANTKEVEVIRNEGGSPVSKKATENDILLPGDRIRVFERWF